MGKNGKLDSLLLKKKKKKKNQFSLTTYLYFWLHPTRKPDSVTAVLAYIVKNTLIPEEKEKKIIISGANLECLNLFQLPDLIFTNTNKLEQNCN